MTGNDKIATDWQSLGQAWQNTPVPPFDAAALQRSVDRRSRRLQMTVVVDLAVAAITLALCVWAMLTRERTALTDIGYLTLIALVLVWMGWGLWQRRRQWRAVDRSPSALLDFELERTRVSLQLARASIWLVTAITLGIFLIVVAVPDSWWPDHVERLQRMFPGLWGVFAVTVVAAVIVTFHSDRLRRRQRHLKHLQASMHERG